MSEERRLIKPEDISLRVEKNRRIADVKGGESYVDGRVADAAVSKQTTKTWDDGKLILRNVADEVFDSLDAAGTPAQTVNLLGSGSAFVEIALSNRRKPLPPLLVADAKAAGLAAFVVEEEEVKLKGELAAWAVKTLGMRTNDPNFEYTQRHVLAPSYEEIRSTLRKASQHTSLFKQLNQNGIFASAVEAKARRAKE
jgi:hypothetical protein